MSDFSTEKLEGFHSPSDLKEIMRKLAALEIIFIKKEDDWLRFFHYVKNWVDGVDYAGMDNGSGDNMHMFFTPAGTLIKGFDHESPVSPHAADVYEIRKGMYDGAPDHLMRLLDDPSIEKDDTTFCIWHSHNSQEWEKGPVELKDDEDDGSGWLLGEISATAEAFKDWADDYHEVDSPLETLQKFFAGEKLTDEMILAINPKAEISAVKAELANIGF
ncbi:MAG TPA: hypothetical protein VK177_04955 [Flavobacteriales bacterium]|nr:hypothetical protein [Flavobacteriales bacterium]